MTFSWVGGRVDTRERYCWYHDQTSWAIEFTSLFFSFTFPFFFFFLLFFFLYSWHMEWFSCRNKINRKKQMFISDLFWSGSTGLIIPLSVYWCQLKLIAILCYYNVFVVFINWSKREFVESQSFLNPKTAFYVFFFCFCRTPFTDTKFLKNCIVTTSKFYFRSTLQKKIINFCDPMDYFHNFAE